MKNTSRATDEDTPGHAGGQPALPALQLEALRALAERAAVEGGRAARQRFGGPLQVKTKKDGSEVTDADEAVQAIVVAALHRDRPDDAFIAEEALPAIDPPYPTPENGRVCWVIDPIDGTRNFIRGVPCYACSVGAMLGGVPVAGAVYDPERDLVYSAASGGPLLLNGAPCTGARAAGQIGKSRALVAIPAKPGGQRMDVVRHLLSRFVCRDLGSATLHLALVATGALDAMFADSTRLWDLAAGYVLVSAAGGTVCQVDGRPWFPIDVAAYREQEMPTVAASPGRAEEILGLIRSQ